MQRPGRSLKHCGFRSVAEVFVEWKHQTMLYLKIGLPGNMSSAIGDSLIFRVETDEFVFEQWDLAVAFKQSSASRDLLETVLCVLYRVTGHKHPQYCYPEEAA